MRTKKSMVDGQDLELVRQVVDQEHRVDLVPIHHHRMVDSVVLEVVHRAVIMVPVVFRMVLVVLHLRVKLLLMEQIIVGILAPDTEGLVLVFQMALVMLQNLLAKPRHMDQTIVTILARNRGDHVLYRQPYQHRHQLRLHHVL